MGNREGNGNAARILEALVASPRPLSAYDLIAKVRPHAIAASPTVYRALKRPMSDGRVHRIESLNAFVACRHSRGGRLPDLTHEGGVGFAICDRCSSADEFADHVVGERLEADLSARAFLPSALVIEVQGVFAVCRSDEVSATT